MTNGGTEIAFPSSTTFYGVKGFLALFCDPAAKQLLFGLLPFHSYQAAFLTIPWGSNFCSTSVSSAVWAGPAICRPISRAASNAFAQEFAWSDPVNAYGAGHDKQQAPIALQPSWKLELLLTAKISKCPNCNNSPKGDYLDYFICLKLAVGNYFVHELSESSYGL